MIEIRTVCHMTFNQFGVVVYRKVKDAKTFKQLNLDDLLMHKFADAFAIIEDHNKYEVIFNTLKEIHKAIPHCIKVEISDVTGNVITYTEE